jgi:hypothetical protein
MEEGKEGGRERVGKEGKTRQEKKRRKMEEVED